MHWSEVKQEIGLTSCSLSIAQLLLGNEEDKNTNAWSVSSGRMRGEGGNSHFIVVSSTEINHDVLIPSKVIYITTH